MLASPEIESLLARCEQLQNYSAQLRETMLVRAELRQSVYAFNRAMLASMRKSLRETERPQALCDQSAVQIRTDLRLGSS